MSNEVIHAPIRADNGATVVRVFVDADKPWGGNPAPVWSHADAMTGVQMQALARASGHESAFVLHAHDGLHDWCMRYFVPNHEMEMCGHATIGALWLLHREGRWNGEPITIRTLSGSVQAHMGPHGVAISQPKATICPIEHAHHDAIAQCLGIAPDRIVGPILNSSTSRAKTLVRLPTAESLHALTVAADQVKALCERIDSTGLYPYALLDGSGTRCSARQFPRSSGYVEDAATGIAAAALAWGLRHQGLTGDQETTVSVRQGEAMGSPSLISVRLPASIDISAPCWLSGEVSLDLTFHKRTS